MGVSSLAARVGGVTAPLVVLLASLARELPVWIFGAAALVSGCLSLGLPETLGRQLASKVE
jgi:hypothetical protein